METANGKRSFNNKLDLHHLHLRLRGSAMVGRSNAMNKRAWALFRDGLLVALFFGGLVAILYSAMQAQTGWFPWPV